MTGKLYWNRSLVYAGMTVLACFVIIDAAPQYTLLHGKLKEWADPVLDKTGLWQGSWELFAPTPDHVNVRIGARLAWKDGTRSTWYQPDWHSMSPFEKARNFRRMSYFDGLWRTSNAGALEPFCQHLAAEQARASFREVKAMVLFQERDVIPYPAKAWRPAYSAPEYSSTSVLYKWPANE